MLFACLHIFMKSGVCMYTSVHMYTSGIYTASVFVSYIVYTLIAILFLGC